MKKLFVGVVLPILAAAAVVGSGFSVWNFGTQGTASATATGNVIVTDPSGSGAYTVTGPWEDAVKKIVLGFDQPNGSNNNQGKGPYWARTSLTNGEPTPITNTGNDLITVEPGTGAPAIKTITTKITLPEVITNWVSLSGTNNPPLTGGVKTYEYVWGNATTLTWSITSTQPTYVKVPGDLTEYETMKQEVQAVVDQIKIEIIVTN